MAGRMTLTVFVIAFGVTAALAGTGVWLAARARPTPNSVEYALIGEAMLSYPAAYARNRVQAGAGRLDRLDLAASFPDFQPAAEAKGLMSEADLDARTARTVFVTVTPDDRSLDPAERPARLYAPLLDPVGFAKPAGLVARRFQQGSPYEGEELYMTPPEGRAFWARCPTPEARGAREPCFTELRANGVNLTVRFAPALLPDWERLRDGVTTLVAGMRR